MTDMADTTEARLAEIAGAVRVRSVTSFDFAGQAFDVAPPLPRRYPALPMVDRLQTELYTRAYCVRLGVAGAADQASSADMLSVLTEANQSRTRADPDWLVTEVDGSGAVSVIKRGVARRIPQTELLQDGAAPQRQGPAPPPQPGRLVAILLPREQPLEGGFYFAFGEAIGSTFEGRPAVRFYWNVPADVAPDLMRALTRTLNARGIPFAFKCPRNSAAYLRRDAGTLFVLQPFYRAVSAALPEIHRAVAGRLRDDVPLFAKPLMAGLGFAEDPGASESFGMSRCRLLAEAIWIAFVEGVAEAPAVVEVMKRHLTGNGIDVARPYLNPWCVDRYGAAA